MRHRSPESPAKTPGQAQDRPRGRLVKWLQGADGHTWGTDPAVYDPGAVQTTMDSAARFFGPGRYFQLEIDGWHHLPAAPVMLVSNHSGGTTIPDVWGFGVAWYQRFGVDRPVHPMAHELIMSTRATGQFFSRRGVVRASHAIGHRVLTEFKRDLMVMPGGDVDTWRPYADRYKVRFAGRTGYARLALQAGVPIVPIANAGAHETLLVLSDGRSIAKRLRLKALARASIFPISLSVPWGLTVGPWPHLPLPTTLRYQIGAPIAPSVQLSPGEQPTNEQIRQLDYDVRCAVQTQLNQLKRRDPKVS